jgi:hypothetical protein
MAIGRYHHPMEVSAERRCQSRVTRDGRSGAIIAARPGDLPRWRQRLRAARNMLSFVLLAAVFTWRSAVTWRQWRRRHRGR